MNNLLLLLIYFKIRFVLKIKTIFVREVGVKTMCSDQIYIFYG